MAVPTWGTSRTWAAPPSPAPVRRVSPSTAAGHRGLVWLHAGALALWLGAAAVLGLVAATGRDVPAAAFAAGALAIIGHAGFLALHGALGAAARRPGPDRGAPAAGPRTANDP